MQSTQVNSESEEAIQPKWLRSSVRFHEGSIEEIHAQIPVFERRSFGITQPSNERSRLNEHLDTIVRRPFSDDPDFIPVGIVSKEYVLVPHTQVFDTALEALKEVGIDQKDIIAQLTITEYGERIAPDKYTVFCIFSCTNDRREVYNYQLAFLSNIHYIVSTFLRSRMFMRKGSIYASKKS